MGYDTRDFIDDLKKRGELVEVDEEVDWNLEIPAYSVISGRFGGPAFLFNNIKGLPKGHRVLTGMLIGDSIRPHRKLAVALGIDPKVDFATWYQELARKMANMLRPVEVATAPCKEVIKMGKDVNLLEFPFCIHSVADGGRHILLNQTINKDPDSDWINTGNYAIEIFSRNRLVIAAAAPQQFTQLYLNKYQARNQSMPVAICLGGDPCVQLTAGIGLPPGVTEYDVAGGLRGVPIELVRAETSDLLIPADAEIVIEGEMRPYERLPEGPKIEAFGFSTGPRAPHLAMRVHCITHRKNPIIPDVHVSVGSDTHCYMTAVTRLANAGMYHMLGLPMKLGVIVSLVRMGATTEHSVIKKKYPEDYPGFMRDLIDTVMGNPVLGHIQNNIVFVDDDVNVLYDDEVYEAMFTQMNPARDVSFYPHQQLYMIMASWMEDRDRRYVSPAAFLGTKIVKEVTTKEEPPQGVRRLNFETLFPDKLQQWVVDNWQRLGFKEEARWNKSYLEAKF